MSSRVLGRFLAVGAGTAIQLGLIGLVAIIWRASAGRWGFGAWAIYLVAFCVVAPLVGVTLARRISPWDAAPWQLAKTVAVMGLFNTLFAFSSHGFEEAGVHQAVYLSGYGALFFAILLGLARRWR